MDKRLFFLLNMAQRRVRTHVDKFCDDNYGVPVTQIGAVMLIAKQPGILQKDLATALSLNKPAVTGLLTRMEANGLITRKPSESDGRAIELFVTDKAVQIATDVKPHLAVLNETMVEGFSEDEILTVLKFLNALMHKF